MIVAIPVDRLGRDSGTICAQALIARPSLTGLTRSLSLFADDLTRCASSPRLALQVRPRTLQMRWQASLLVHSLSPRRFRVSPQEQLVSRIRAYCLANLDDPGLCVGSIARAVGVSARQVHKACAAQGFSVAAWVRRERLDRISRDLTDASLRNRSVAAIAARWGIRVPVAGWGRSEPCVQPIPHADAIVRGGHHRQRRGTRRPRHRYERTLVSR